MAHHPDVGSVDWGPSTCGGRRAVPALGHPDRNETQARTALLDRLPLDPARVHPMPPADGPPGDDVDAAARGYAELLRAAAGHPPQGRLEGRPVAGALPVFDVLLLGVGPDGHVASLFPGHPALAVTDTAVVGVRESPKPPPVRVSLTVPALCHAREVWLLAAGSAKAAAVAEALTSPSGGTGDRGPATGETPPVGPGRVPHVVGTARLLPAARPRGRRATVWFLDRDAAGLPPET